MNLEVILVLLPCTSGCERLSIDQGYIYKEYSIIYFKITIIIIISLLSFISIFGSGFSIYQPPLDLFYFLNFSPKQLNSRIKKKNTMKHIQTINYIYSQKRPSTSSTLTTIETPLNI